MTDTTTVDSAVEPLDAGEPPPPADPADFGAQPARLATLVLVLAAMTILGGWELLVIVMAVVAFIIIHELGHYLTARWSGMKVTEFFIGFGPRIVAYRRGETIYGIKAVPLGAYVRIIGMNNLEEVDPTEEHRAYRSKPWHKRFITTAAGPATHFVIAVVLAGVAIWQFGEPVEDEWEIRSVVPFSAADAAGLEAGDKIVSLNGQPTDEFATLADLVQGVRGEIVELEVERDGRPMTVQTRIGERLTAVGSSGISGLYVGDLVLGIGGQEVANYDEFAALASDRVGEKVVVDVVYDGARHEELVTINRISTADEAVVGFLGVAEGEVRAPLPLGDAATEAPLAVGRGTAELASRFGDMFTSREGLSALFALPDSGSDTDTMVTYVDAPDQIRPRAEIDENRLLSIVGAVGIGKQLVDDGLAVVLFFLVGLNISLALLNLLPLLPFDGGHMAIATYERLRSFGGRQHRVDAERLLPITYVVVAFVMLVGMIAVIRDIVDPIQL